MTKQDTLIYLWTLNIILFIKLELFLLGDFDFTPCLGVNTLLPWLNYSLLLLHHHWYGFWARWYTQIQARQYPVRYDFIRSHTMALVNTREKKCFLRSCNGFSKCMAPWWQHDKSQLLTQRAFWENSLRKFLPSPSQLARSGKILGLLMFIFEQSS